MNVLCHDRNCHCAHSANGKSSRAIRREVQAGVDVAIATKILTLACENRLDGVVLLAGDGDFVDAVKYVKETLNKKVFVVGFKDSLSARLMPYAESPNGVVILDDFVELVAAGGTGVIGNGGNSNNGNSSGSNGVARPRSPPSDGDFAASLVPSAPSAAEMWAASSSRNNSSSRSNSNSNNSSNNNSISRQNSNNEELVRQLVNVGVADEAACRHALHVANWNIDEALDALFAQKEAQLSSPPRASPPVAAPAPVAADATPLLLQLQAQKQQQLQQEQQEQQRKQERLLKLLQQERMDEPAPPPIVAAPPRVAKSPPPVAKSVTPPQSASPKSVSPKLSARTSTSSSSAASLAAANDESHAIALVIMSSVRELQGMGFEGEAAERALHANGGDLRLALNSLLKQSS